MDLFVRLTALIALGVAAAATNPASADYGGPDGYGTTSTYELDVARDGYVHEGEDREPVDPTTYVVIDAENGETEEVDGQTVVVVQEPEPLAVTEEAPPPPRTVVVEQPSVVCSDGIWVDGYWSYGNGDYVWVDGHCVVERVNYVFVHPRWDYYANLWWFVPGYYRPCGVYVGFGYFRPWFWFPPYYAPYYRGYRPVPVHRGTAWRPTTVRGPSAYRAPHHGVTGRPGYPRERADTVHRQSPTRTPSVNRSAPTRVSSVGRPPPTRTPSVNRSAPTRVSNVGRPPPTRVSSVGRPPPARVSSVGRPPPTRAPVVGRPPPTPVSGVTRTASTRAATVTRTSPNSTSVSSVGRARPAATLPAGVVYRPPARTAPVSQARDNSARVGSVRRAPSAGSVAGFRPSAGVSSRSSYGRTPGFSAARTGFGAASRGGGFSRPSVGGGGGGFSRPSSGGFGGARSVPTARGR